MSRFKNHYKLYDGIMEQTGGKGKFVGLVSRLCGYLEPKQIFELYEISRGNLKNNTDFINNYHMSQQGLILDKSSGKPIDDMPLRRISESYIFSAIVLNAAKLVMNKKLEMYEKVLVDAVGHSDIIKNYVLNTEFLSTKRAMLRKIDVLREDKKADSAEREYLERLYATELRDISNSCTEVYSSLFHMGIPQKADSEGVLAEHYSSAEIILNTEKILYTKNAFLSYLEQTASDQNNYRQILGFTKAIEEVLLYQETQEIRQGEDWIRTDAVLDFVCPMKSYATIDEFFSDPAVKKYITPTRIGKGRLYVHALRESEEINLMARYLIENISHGRIKLARHDKELKCAVKAIMPQKCESRVIDAIRAKKLQLSVG
ncbi:MAG: hypothetical protein U9O53_05995 [archaeon]|nr:hypothetical protein [archaeon]